MSSPTFGILWRDQIIGHSALEFGDPPMGVAFGQFAPADGFGAFCEVAPRSARSSGDLQVWDDLSATNPEGDALECVCVSLSRFEHGGEVDLQVEAVGIDALAYERHFPHHLRDYGRRFGPPSG